MLNCRSCASDKLSSIIPLGTLPLANALLSTPMATESRHNLEVMLCEACGLAQLKDLIDPAELFSEYVYFSSNSDTMLDSVAQLSRRIIPTLPLNALIVEIASNDGYLLKNYVQAGVTVLGIDPAENIAKVANDRGIPTLCAFFGEDLAKELVAAGKKADVIHANNVLAHVPDINGFIKGLKILLKDEGHAVIEVPYLMDLVKKLEFDTVYHEHVYYFSVTALKAAFERYGLVIFNIEKLALHGGSLRLFIGHEGCQIQPIVQKMIQEEEMFNLHQAPIYVKLMGEVERLKNALTTTLQRLKSEGARIAAYGASAKGTTLLNYFGIGKEWIDFIVDRSPVKQGKFTPGTQLEIFPPSRMIEENITHALLLSWNFADEIMGQQKDFVAQGGKFILPLPEVRVLS